MKNRGIEYGQIQGIAEKASRAAYLTIKNILKLVCQGRVGDPHREGWDGAPTVADGCVDIPAILVQIAAPLSPHARVAGRRSKTREKA